MLSNLKESLEEYDMLQERCIKTFAHLNSDFTWCTSLEFLKSKFISLNEKEILSWLVWVNSDAEIEK